MDIDLVSLFEGFDARIAVGVLLTAGALVAAVGFWAAVIQRIARFFNLVDSRCVHCGSKARTSDWHCARCGKEPDQ